MANSNIFSDYIHTENISDFNVIKLEQPKFSLSKNEVKQDFETFKAIMLYAYSGRQFWENKTGFSFFNFFEKAEKELFKGEHNYFDLHILSKLYYSVVKN